MTNTARTIGVGMFIAIVVLALKFAVGWEQIVLYIVVSFAAMVAIIFPEECVEFLPGHSNDGKVLPDEYVQVVGLVVHVGCILKLLFLK